MQKVLGNINICGTIVSFVRKKYEREGETEYQTKTNVLAIYLNRYDICGIFKH